MRGDLCGLRQRRDDHDRDADGPLRQSELRSEVVAVGRKEVSQTEAEHSDLGEQGSTNQAMYSEQSVSPEAP